LRFLLLAVGAAETLFAVWDQKLRTGAGAAGVRLAPVASSSLGWAPDPVDQQTSGGLRPVELRTLK